MKFLNITDYLLNIDDIQKIEFDFEQEIIKVQCEQDNYWINCTKQDITRTSNKLVPLSNFFAFTKTTIINMSKVHSIIIVDDYDAIENNKYFKIRFKDKYSASDYIKLDDCVLDSLEQLETFIR